MGNICQLCLDQRSWESLKGNSLTREKNRMLRTCEESDRLPRIALKRKGEVNTIWIMEGQIICRQGGIRKDNWWMNKTSRNGNANK